MALVQRALFLLLSPVVLLIGIELAFRLFSPYPGNWATYEQRDRYLYFHRPRSVGWETSPLDEWAPVKLRYNEYGLRGADFPLAKEPGERRVLVLGDSYVEARQLPDEQTPTAQLESLLRARLGGNIRVLNGGMTAWASVPEYLYLTQDGIRLAPDLVVLYFTFNDYTDNAVKHWLDDPRYLDEGLPDRLKPVEYADDWEPPTPEARWARRSALYAFLYRMRVSQETRRKVGQPEPWYIQTHTLDLNAKGVFNTTLTETEERVVASTHASLARLEAYCAAQGIPLVVAIIPWPHQVSGAEWNPGKLLWGYQDGEMVESAVYPQRLTAFLDQAGMAYVDLLPPFQAAGPARLHFDFDGHWNAHGARTAATAVSALIEQRPDLRRALQVSP